MTAPITAQTIAAAAPPPDPAMVLIYGKSGIGKSTDCIYSFSRAFFIAEPAAVRKPAEGVVGMFIHPNQVKNVSRIAEATQIVEKLGSGFNAVVADDWTYVTEATLSAIRAEHEEKKRKGLKPSDFDVWNQLKDEMMKFLGAMRKKRLHFVANCHEQPTTMKGANAIDGGPKLPMKELVTSVPGLFDVVLHAVPDPTRMGMGWSGVYRCGPMDIGYMSKDRHNVTPDNAPMNLGEILRAAHFKIERAPGLEWIEELVVVGSDGILKGANPVEVKRWIVGKVQERTAQDPAYKAHPDSELWMKHAVWAMRDAQDRVIFTRHKGNRFSAYGI